MGINEKLLVLYPTKEGIMVKTLFYYDEIAAIPKSVPRMKLDGFRCLAYIDYGMVDLRNKRNIRMLPRFPELKEISKNVGGRCILDGEIVVLTNGVLDFYRLQKRTLLTDKFKIEMEALRYPASFVAFDCIYIEGKELIWTPLMDRKEQLSRIVNEDSRISVSRYVEGSGLRFIWRRGEQTGRRCCKKKRQLLSDGETNEGLDQIQTDGRRGLCSSRIYQKRRTYV